MGHVCCTEGQSGMLLIEKLIKTYLSQGQKYVYDFLLEKGVSKERMSYEGLAHKFPLEEVRIKIAVLKY